MVGLGWWVVWEEVLADLLVRMRDSRIISGNAVHTTLAYSDRIAQCGAGTISLREDQHVVVGP